MLRQSWSTDILRTALRAVARRPASSLTLIVTIGLGIGATTFPAAGSAGDLALLLTDYHGADLIVTVGYPGTLDDFFDRSRRESNPSTFLTRMKVGPKLVDAKAVATLYRSRVSGAAVAFVVLAALIAVIAAVMLSSAGGEVTDWVVAQWHQLVEWARGVWNR